MRNGAIVALFMEKSLCVRMDGVGCATRNARNMLLYLEAYSDGR